MDMSDIQDEVERFLRKQTIEVLYQVVALINAPEEEWKDSKRKRTILGSIQFTFDDMSDDDRLEAFTQIASFIPETSKETYLKIISLPNLEDEKSQEDNTVNPTPTIVKPKPITTFDEEPEKKPALASAATLSDEALEILKCLPRKEFRIQGVIGGTGENSLDYVGLCCQITEALKMRYSPLDLVCAVRRCVATGSTLRRYLDSVPHLSLENVLASVRSWCKEKSATELLSDLNSLYQNETESSQEFLFRALGLRHRILTTSHAESSIFRYDEIMIHQLFLHAVKTDLRSSEIRSHMAPFLDRTKNVPNQTLILEMEKASAEENERLTKQKKVPDRMNVNEIKVAGMDTLIKQMSSMNEELKTLKADIKNVKDAKKGTNNIPGNDLPVKIASQTILNHVLTAGNVVLLAISQEIARNRRETKSDF